MAFKFSLESILKLRKRSEDIAQREFAEAQAAVDACLFKIEQMYQRLDEVREEILQAQRVGSVNKLEEIRSMESFLSGQKIRIETVRQEARGLLQIAEIKQEALVSAARDKKMLIKLREKRQIEYQEWLRNKETKELDDMTMVRQAWGKK